MDKIVIDGIFGYDGEYDIDFGTLTMREHHTIKRLSGLRALEISEAWLAGDLDLVLALAVIALERAGRRVNETVLWDAETGKIRLVFTEDPQAGPDGDEEGDEERPPEGEAPPAASSGDASRPTLVRSESDRSRTGSPRSAPAVT